MRTELSHITTHLITQIMSLPLHYIIINDRKIELSIQNSQISCFTPNEVRIIAVIANLSTKTKLHTNAHKMHIVLERQSSL